MQAYGDDFFQHFINDYHDIYFYMWILCLAFSVTSVYHMIVSALSWEKNHLWRLNSTSVYTCICATKPTHQNRCRSGDTKQENIRSIYSGKWQRADKSHLQNICPKGEYITILSALRFYFHEHASSPWILYELLTAGNQPSCMVK